MADSYEEAKVNEGSSSSEESDQFQPVEYIYSVCLRSTEKNLGEGKPERIPLKTESKYFGIMDVQNFLDEALFEVQVSITDLNAD